MLIASRKVLVPTTGSLRKLSRILSPDFLLVDEVFINGHQVRWIDAKNYYGSSDVNVRTPPPSPLALVPALLLPLPHPCAPTDADPIHEEAGQSLR